MRWRRSVKPASQRRATRAPIVSEIILVLGGTRSGKSEIAERLVMEREGPVAYVATCHAGDEELRKRIEIHRRRRPPDWITVEAPRDPLTSLRALAPPPGVVLLDCLSFLVFNLMGDDMEDDAVLDRVKTLFREARAITPALVIVSNDVSGAWIPPDPVSRRYQDLLGRANQRAAVEADRVILAVAGIAMSVKSPTL